MLFNSVRFLFVFFPLVTALYFLAPHRWRWLLLLIASAYFYMAFVPKYILILVALILIDYTAGRLIERAQGRRRGAWLAASLIANIAILASFKYFNFANGNVAALAHAIGWNYGIKNLTWLLPIGLSFHTFQSMAYTIEVYRGDQPAERHLGRYALYVMYYPQLVAGPIERPQNLLPQFNKVAAYDTERVVSGLKLMLWGLFRKVFVADRLAIVVDSVYGNPLAHDGWSAPYILATYFFAFQVYFDFAGYSDIARGASRVMGVELMENFRFPFTAGSVSEFWQRWHISLSTWFKDYLYLPLVYGSRDKEGAIRTGRGHLYILIVFLASGFWHGAGWNFGLWGACHGIFIVCSALTKTWRARIRKRLRAKQHRELDAAWKALVTFHLVWFTWILFRADTLADAGVIMRNICSLRLEPHRFWLEYLRNNDVQVGLFGIGLIMSIEWLQKRGVWDKLLARRFGFTFAEAFHAAMLALIVVGAPVSERAFIYFQF